jgi:hypothetical protein
MAIGLTTTPVATTGIASCFGVVIALRCTQNALKNTKKAELNQ